MLERCTKFALIIFSLAIFTSPANAWNIDLTSTDNLTWDISLTVDEGGISLGGYFLDFFYDTTQLNWADDEWFRLNDAIEGYIGPYTNTPPTGLYTDFMGKPVENPSSIGYIRNLNGMSLMTDANVTGTISLGSLTFEELASVQDGVADVTFAMNNFLGLTIDGELIGSDSLHITINEEGHFRASTVPVPGAVWLLASGLLGLVGIRRKTA